MSEKETSESSRLLSLAVLIGSMLVFAVFFYIAYLPGRPPAVDHDAAKERKQLADEARAAGIAKINNLEVIDEAAGTIRIPLEDAVKLTVKDYQSSTTDEKEKPEQY